MQRSINRVQGDYRLLHDEDDDENDFEVPLEQNEWHTYRTPRTVFSASDEVNPSFQAKGSRTPIEPTQIYLLRKGDHVGWHRPIGLYWHHAIVCDTDYRLNWIQVIHFTKVRGKIRITKEWLNVNQQKGDFFRFDYSEDTNRMNPRDIVLKRANARVGETGYHLFKKNCEHFATYCKTGKEDCAQVHWAKGKVKEGAHACAANVVKSSVRLTCSVAKEAGKQTYKSVAAASSRFAQSGGKLAGAFAKEAGRQGYKGVAESTAKVAGAEALEHVGKASNWVGAGAVAGIETVHCAYDIYQMNKNRKAGKITDKDFKVCTTQRVSEGVMGGGIAIGGSILGEYLGGLAGGAIGSLIPVVGTVVGAAVGAFVGSVIGGAIGSFVGKIFGTSFGRWLGGKLFG